MASMNPEVALAHTIPVTYLPGWVRRRADVATGEAGLLLHRANVSRSYADPGCYHLWVLDDLVPGFIVDHRRFARVRTQPFTLILAYPGLPTGDGGYVSCHLDLSVLIADPKRLLEHFGVSATSAPVAITLRQSTAALIKSQALQYSESALGNQRQVSLNIHGVMSSYWRSHLADWGLELREVSPPVFLPEEEERETSFERLVEALKTKGVFKGEQLSELAYALPSDNEAALKALSSVVNEFLEEQTDGDSTPLASTPADHQMSKPLMVLLVGLAMSGIGGGAAAQNIAAVKQVVEGIPLVGVTAAPMVGFLATSGLSVGLKWFIGRLIGKRSRTRSRRDQDRLQAQELAAWRQVEIRRAQRGIQTAFAGLSSWAGQISLEESLVPMVRDARNQLAQSLAAFGTGMLASDRNQGRFPKEDILALRLFLASRALPKLVGQLSVPPQYDSREILQGVLRLAQEVSTSLDEWQTFRLNLHSRHHAR